MEPDDGYVRELGYTHRMPPAAREELLFLRAIALGKSEPDDWAGYAWASLGEGDPAALRSDARAFARIRLPVLKALRSA